MSSQVVKRIAAPLARRTVGAQRRQFVGGLVNKQNQVVKNQKFFQRQGVRVNDAAPTWQRRGQSDKGVAGVWAVGATLMTLISVKMIVDMTWGWNKREGM